MSKDLAVQVTSLVEQAKAITVFDVTTCEAAGAMRKVLKSMENTIIDHYKPLKKAIDVSKKVILDQEKEDLVPVLTAYNLLSKDLTDFLNAEEVKRKAAAEEAIRLNNLAADKEREKLLNQAAKAKTEERQEALLEKAEMVYAAPVAVAHTIAAPIAGVTRRKDTVVTVTNVEEFYRGMVEQNRPLSPVSDIKPGPLKAFVKMNALKVFPGLFIEEKFV